MEDTGIPHGTQIAGIIGAKRNNQIGIAGIAGGDGSDTAGCSLIDFKSPFLSPAVISYRLASVVDAARSAGSYFDYGDNYHNGGGNDFYFNSAKGFGVHIGNHSYTIRTVLPLADEEKTPSADSSSVIEVTECDLCREAYLFSLQNGVINVVGRGNNGFDNGDPTYVEDLTPQNLPDGWIISVGASGYDGNTVEEGVNQSISEQSSGFYSLYGGNMDLVAPGSDSIVYSTLTTNVSGLYRKFNGTSAAAPHVAGVAALLLSHYNRPCYSNQNLTIEDVEYLLEKSATDIFDSGPDLKSGAGRLNAGAALEMIKDPTKQIIHPDSLISSIFLAEDTILLAYHRAFVGDGWGPISQAIPLERERQYKVV
ncbi:MAG: S8 family serine peptidase [Brumimicrobium sp.]|nr:S8 family serine peptidase [Brumimicrobium sp.]